MKHPRYSIILTATDLETGRVTTIDIPQSVGLTLERNYPDATFYGEHETVTLADDIETLTLTMRPLRDKENGNYYTVTTEDQPHD